MIYEIALEPELVASWRTATDFRYFVQAFGVGTNKIVSRYPKDWKKLVWSLSDSATEVERKRLEELLVRIGETMARRSGVFNEAQDWLTNARREHQRVSFSLTLARTGDEAGVVVGVDRIDDSGLWHRPTGVTCPRIATDMANAVKPLLRMSRRIVFVDPYFSAAKKAHTEALSAFLDAAIDERPGQPPEAIKILTKKRATMEFFASECQVLLPSSIPAGVQVTIRRLAEKAPGEKLHNRYILTELGGISFGVGLDQGAASETDDLNVLAADQYKNRWTQYVDPGSGFDRPEPDLLIVGTGRVSDSSSRR
jgi:hypothetical protein